MKVKRILKVEQESENVDLCKECRGKGWYWSILEFGDLPGDETKIRCEKCGGLGRTKVVSVVAEIVVPVDWKIEVQP